MKLVTHKRRLSRGVGQTPEQNGRRDGKKDHLSFCRGWRRWGQVSPEPQEEPWAFSLFVGPGGIQLACVQLGHALSSSALRWVWASITF